MDRGSSSSSSSRHRREAPTTIGARTPSGLSDFTQAKVREAENRTYLLHDVLGDPSADKKLKGWTRDRLEALGKHGLLRSWEGIDDYMSNESGFSFLPREYISRIFIRHYENEQSSLDLSERIAKSRRLAGPQGGLRLRHLIIAALYDLAHSPENELITRCQSGELRSFFRGFCLTSAALLGFLVRYGTPRLLQIIHAHTGMLSIRPAAECPANQAELEGMTEFELNLVYGRYEGDWQETDGAVTTQERDFWEQHRFQIDSEKEWRLLEPEIGSKILVFSVEGQVVDYFVNPTAMAAYRNDPQMLRVLDRCYGEQLQAVLQVAPTARMVRNPAICLLNRLYCDYLRFQTLGKLPSRRSIECLVWLGMHSGMPEEEWISRFAMNFVHDLSDNLWDVYDNVPSWSDYYNTGHMLQQRMETVARQMRRAMEIEIRRMEEDDTKAGETTFVVPRS